MNQAAAFRSLRWSLLRNATGQLYAASRVRLFTMITTGIVIWGCIFATGLWGFDLVSSRNISSTGGIFELLFDSLFFTLGGLLVFSTGLIVYASLFTGNETRFLLTTPATADRIFAAKFQGAVGFSSWAFLVLGLPILVAYGITYRVSPLFFLAIPFFLAGFIIIPGAAGSLIALLVVNFMPRRRKLFLIVLAATGFALLSLWLVRTFFFLKESTGNRDSLQGIFDMFRLARQSWMPNHWMSAGLLAFARAEWQDGLYCLALIWSNALMLFVICTFAAKRLYRRGYDRLSALGGGYKRYGDSILDRMMLAFTGYLDIQTRTLILKDFRTFRREPAQVGQLGLFAVLLLLCVMNSRQFFKADIPVAYQHGLSLLNLGATGMLICAYLGRFIYPLISLEGRKFWILGLLPLKRSKLLWGKFAFALTGTLIFGVGMVLLSDLVLNMPWIALCIHVFAMAVMVTGMCGMAVGVSAWLPNFRETDPSKIVVGFGGTMFTIAGFAYMVFCIALICGPYHAGYASVAVTQLRTEHPWWTFAGIPVGLAMAVAAVWVPMRAGIRRLNAMEF